MLIFYKVFSSNDDSAQIKVHQYALHLGCGVCGMYEVCVVYGVSVYLHTHLHTRLHTYTYTHLHTRAHAHTYTHTYTHLRTYTNLHIHTHTHLHTHPYTHLHTPTHTYTPRPADVFEVGCKRLNASIKSISCPCYGVYFEQNRHTVSTVSAEVSLLRKLQLCKVQLDTLPCNSKRAELTASYAAHFLSVMPLFLGKLLSFFFCSLNYAYLNTGPTYPCYVRYDILTYRPGNWSVIYVYIYIYK